jgi:positive regulator of sigma E activity
MRAVDGSPMRDTAPATTLRSALLAPMLDAIALLIFVAAGRESHGLDEGAAWFLGVLWPIVAGWFAVALIVLLYTRRTHQPLRLAVTIVAGVGAGLLLRAAVTHRATPVAFLIVAYAFITLLTAGWRLVALGVREMVRRRAAVS